MIYGDKKRIVRAICAVFSSMHGDDLDIGWLADVTPPARRPLKPAARSTSELPRPHL
jgi:hypothetical protein